MMLNKVMIIGNLGRDPEVRQANGAVANFSVAVNERFKDRNGQQQDRAEWVNCVAWGRLAEVVQQYVHKGSKVFVEGKLQTRKWTDKQGVERYTTEVNVSNLQMLTGRKEQQPSAQPFAQQQPFDDLPF